MCDGGTPTFGDRLSFPPNAMAERPPSVIAYFPQCAMAERPPSVIVYSRKCDRHFPLK
jgi:hypothetical protein